MKKIFSILLLGMATLMFAPTLFSESVETSIVSNELTSNILLGVGVAVFIIGLIPMAKGVFSVLSVQDSRNLITSASVAKYIESPMVFSFLRSFFTPVTKLTLAISIEVRRGTEKLAVDILRGTPGNMNRITRSTEKMFVPPLFEENVIMNDTDLYYQAIATQSEVAFAELANEFAENLVTIREKIERRYEYMCAQVLETGIVTMVNGDNIDFKRKAGSKVDKGAGNYWTTTTVNPFTDMAAGIKFVREQGKGQGFYYNAIFGEQALDAFLASPFYVDRNVLTVGLLDSIAPPIRNSVGGTLHGEITVGSYKVRVWSYSEVYEDAAGVMKPYKDPKTVVILPDNPKFVFGHAAVPQLIKGNTVPQSGAFLIDDYVNEESSVHTMRVKSAGIPIPVAVDQIYTVKVIA